MPKGIIMSIAGREAVILTQDSNFVRVMLPAGEYGVGQEIDAANNKNSLMHKWAFMGIKRWGAIAAVLLVAIILPIITTTVFLDSAVYAYVTLDINPSTEFTINQHDRIIGIQPLNEQASIVLEGAKLKGKNIEYGIEFFLIKACQLGYSKAQGQGAVIATTIMEEGENADLEQKVSATLDRTIDKNQLSLKAGVLSATKQIKEEADKAGVSAGKYLIALQASDDQLNVDMEDVKNSSIGSVISKAGGNLQSILKRAHKNNEELTKLLEDNRNKLKSNNGRDNSGNDNNGDDNSGKSNNGRDNSGRDNSGNDNSSKSNYGRDNSGNDNNGDDNSGRGNSGNDNNGKDNSGRGNSGNDNNGDDNSGKSNNGRGNSANDNSGKSNNGTSNNDKNNNVNNNNGNRKGKSGVIEEIIMQLFD